jgi:hypothetical protein
MSQMKKKFVFTNALILMGCAYNPPVIPDSVPRAKVHFKANNNKERLAILINASCRPSILLGAKNVLSLTNEKHAVKSDKNDKSSSSEYTAEIQAGEQHIVIPSSSYVTGTTYVWVNTAGGPAMMPQTNSAFCNYPAFSWAPIANHEYRINMVYGDYDNRCPKDINLIDETLKKIVATSERTKNTNPVPQCPQQ